MARPNEKYLALGPLRGMNGTENPLVLGPEWATQTLNVTLDPCSAVAIKRRGSVVVSDAPPNTYMMHRHLPNVIPPPATEADAELWAFTYNGVAFGAFRKIGGAAFTPVTVPSGLAQILRAVSFNGKIFFGATTATNRMYLWDGTAIRLAGIIAPLPPTLGAVAGGPAVAVQRWYRVSFQTVGGGGAITLRGEPSAVVTTTPIAGQGVRVTRPSVPASDVSHVTHWTIWASADNAVFWRISGPNPLAVLFVDDLLIPATYASITGDPMAPIGSYLPLPAATRVITDGNRLLMAGWGCAPNPALPGELDVRSNRVWYTPVLADVLGDDERVPVTVDRRNFLDLGDNTTNAVITELAGPMDGQVYVFQRRRIWRMVGTGDLITPYVSFPVSDRYGARAVPQHTNVCAVTGENQHGQPAVYFLGDVGVYRISSQTNIEYVSFDIETDYLASTNNYPWIFAYPEAKQLWLVTYPLVGPGLGPPRIFVFHWDQGRPDEDGDVIGGWTRWEHAGTTALFGTGTLHNRTPGNSSQAGTARVPYLTADIASTGTTLPYKFDGVAELDGASAFAGWVRYAPLMPTQAHALLRVGPAQMVALAGLVGRSVSCSYIRDFGVQRYDATVSIEPLAAEGARVVRTLELFQGDITALEVVVGDLVPQPWGWRVEWLVIPLYPQEPR